MRKRAPSIEIGTFYHSEASQASERVDEVWLLNLSSRVWKQISAAEALSLNPAEDIPRVLVVIKHEDCIPLIRKAFGLHPIIDKECVPSTLTVCDQFLDFEDYFLLTLSDLGASDKLQVPVSFKVVVFPHFLLMFCEHLPSCVSKVSKELSCENLQVSSRNRFYSLKVSQHPPQALLDVNLPDDSSLVETFLVKMLNHLVNRLECIVLTYEEESKACYENLNLLEREQRSQFIIELSLARQNLIYIHNITQPKAEIFEQLLAPTFLQPYARPIVYSMHRRIKLMVKKLQNLREIFHSAEHVYECHMEESLNKSTQSLDLAMKRFSSIATIFLPILFIAMVCGSNIAVPNGTEETVLPFMEISGICLYILTVMCLYFYNKNLI